MPYNFVLSLNLNQLKKLFMKKILILVVAASAFIFACDKDKNKEKTFKSSEVTVFGGKAWSTVTVKDGVPQQLSFVINDAALNSAAPGTDQAHNPANDFLIPLPAEALSTTPYKWIMLNWNPAGHEPEHVYTIPHFDIHYYQTAPDEVMNYMDEAKLNTDVPAGYVPANHVSGPGIPMMGKHYIDAAASELNGQTFTQTFLFGSYNGKVVFWEPMITQNFLKNTSNFERPIPQPEKFQQAGYYPTKMKVVKKGNQTEVTLTGFQKRQAS
jgi:hypothetical protein